MTNTTRDLVLTYLRSRKDSGLGSASFKAIYEMVAGFNSDVVVAKRAVRDELWSLRNAGEINELRGDHWTA